MRAPDKVVGSVLLVSSVVLYIYYSIWVLLTVRTSDSMPSIFALTYFVLQSLQPFFDEGHPIQDFFLPYHYAISVPAVLLVLLFTGAATFIGMVMIESREKKKWN
ncbi:putative dolichol phosphate-mannose biosynthesis regulatory [Plasmopara halstedii]